MFGQVVTEGQIVWYNRPAHAPRLLGREELVNAEVKRRQSSAYMQLSILDENMMKYMDAMKELVGSRV